MRHGDIIRERFEIGPIAGKGGMGQVFRARDLLTGEPVAVKVLFEKVGTNEARFAQEARALSELSHPNIVRYVAHGVTKDNDPYLIMEWLEGEDLAQRLEREALTIDESLVLAQRVAEGLGAAHARGLVHRDLKPSNIFLVEKRADAIKVLDFGVVRLSGATRVTREGGIVGTPGYMAPEQAQSRRQIDARADVFSLACVLFECLTGSLPFDGDEWRSIMAKVIFADPPRLRDLRPELPDALEQLVMQMMAKDPEQRPRDGSAVAEAIQALRDAGISVNARPRSIALTRGERRTISIVLVAGSTPLGLGRDSTLDTIEANVADALRDGARTWGGELELMRDGSVVVSIVGSGPATDQVAQAARCALWLRTHAQDRAIALSTGRADVTGVLAASDAIDRAVKMLLLKPAPDGAASGGPLPILIDELTERLLDGRFDVRESDGGTTLHGEREIAVGSRLLFNKPTPCVGRDSELSAMARTFADCIDEPQAHAALVTGGPGSGKSRFAVEILDRLRSQGEPFAVWMARGDVLRAGSALGLLSQALRSACAVRGDEPLPERREKIEAHVASRVAESERQRVAEVLGEIIGAPFPDTSSALLRAARRDAQIMNDEMRRAWTDFLRAECERQPVLLMLEDLHWGDAPTVRFVDAALRDLADRPFMVLALARPEVHDLFPQLWTSRRMQEIHLQPLGRKASERLVRHVLGDTIGGEIVERIIKQADGNAFYLEELIRATAQHGGDKLPETVVAMVQSRLMALDEADRRSLRAASIFGEVFWGGGVAALLGGEDRAAHIVSRLASLVDREVLVRRPASRFSSEPEFSFRHILFREAAYEALTDADRTLGHCLAGDWLERAGENEPKLLAEHFDRGNQPARAASHFLHAAEQALDGGDYDAVLTLSERGSARASEPEIVAGLMTVAAEAALSKGDLGRALRAAEEALSRVRSGSLTEGRAIRAGLVSALYLKRTELLKAPMEKLLQADPEPEAVASIVAAHWSAVMALLWGAQRGMAELYMQRIEAVAAGTMEQEPMVAAWVEMARSGWALYVERDFWGFGEHARRALAAYSRSGAGGELPFARINLATSYWLLGDIERSEKELQRIAEAGSPLDALFAKHNRSEFLLDLGRYDEAAELASYCTNAFDAQGELLIRMVSRLCWLEAQLYKGNTDVAAAGALEIKAAEEMPNVGLYYAAVLARIRLAQGLAAEASDIAERAYSRAQACGMGYCTRHAMLLLVRAEAFEAMGDHDAARRAIGEAEADLLRRAGLIPDPEVRRSFLENPPVHHRTIELAGRWLTSEAPSGG